MTDKISLEEVEASLVAGKNEYEILPDGSIGKKTESTALSELIAQKASSKRLDSLLLVGVAIARVIADSHDAIKVMLDADELFNWVRGQLALATEPFCESSGMSFDSAWTLARARYLAVGGANDEEMMRLHTKSFVLDDVADAACHVYAASLVARRVEAQYRLAIDAAQGYLVAGESYRGAAATVVRELYEQYVTDMDNVIDEDLETEILDLNKRVTS